ncbi:MAG: RNA polymerase sigma factor [Chitinophagia bacterium]|jgi:RNA polymerase sigma factor (sigma-70 family)|nr:RNA polymerase sigma factor [Chitinophagia bacterium]
MASDSELIVQFQQKNNREQAFTQLMQKHQVKVYHQIKRMVLNHDDADDVAQIVWIKIWDKLDGFKMESEFSTWLFRIAYNETLNFIAKEKRKSTSSLDQDNGTYENHSSLTDAPKSTNIQIQLEQAIKQLPEKQRFVFMLRYFEELNYEKIASITGTTVGGAKANYHQAIKKLEEFIKGH